MLACNMLALLFYTCVLLPTALAANANESIYLVTVTSQAVGGSTETLCAQLQPKEPVTFTVMLQMKDAGNLTLLEESVTEDFYRCIPFQVPPVTKDTVATVHVAVQGKTEALAKKSKIVIKASTLLTLIQTDKPVYKPGQTVQFRVVSLDQRFLSYTQVYPTVELQDPNGNRIAQWLNQSTAVGMLDLSTPMSSEATQGIYTITAWGEKGQRIRHTFEIKEYVLPKYEVKIHLPSVITILETQATLKVCGKYTYGKPVLGSVKAEVCRKSFRFYWFRNSELHNDICKKYSMTTDKTGCATEIIDVTEFALNVTRFQDYLEVESEMEEYGTGVVLKGTGSLRITSEIVTVTFEETPQAFKPEIPFEGKIKAIGPDSGPMANETLLLVANYGAESENWTLTTDSQGMAHFSLDTTPWMLKTVNLQAYYRKPEQFTEYVHGLRRSHYRSANLWLKAFYSKSNSFLKLKSVRGKLSCDTDAPIMAQYIIQGEELTKEQESIDVFYLVLSRGSLVQHGRLQVPVKTGQVNKGDLSFSLRDMVDLAPFAQVVVYTLMPDGEAVADSADFPIHLCLKNKASLKFSSLQELPGEKTTLSLSAHPGSLCSLRAVDQSVLLMEPENKLTVESVYSQLPVQRLSGYYYSVEDEDPYPCNSFPDPLEPLEPLQPFPEPELELEEPDVLDIELLPAVELVEDVESSAQPVPGVLDGETVEVQAINRSRRSVYFGPNDEKHDVYNIFKEVGIKILTNSDVKRPRLGSGDLVAVGDSGSVKVEKTVPDTITKWAAGALCTSPVGLGLAPTVGLTAFQPFFASLTLPYSVIRGEVFTLKATVFNYLSKCIMVQLTLAESSQFTARPCEGCRYTHCLCGDESRTFNWIVTPTALGEVSVKVSAEALKTEDLCGNEVVTVPERGRIDTVIRTLLVEAEGTEQTISHNALLCPAEGPVEQAVSVTLPEVIVEGSEKASVSVLGDLMGRAMQNLDQLLAMPYGCGEQNMLLFAPNIFVLQYLESTKQLTQKIKEKAVRFLESGYQRELNYKHEDGSYSAFGMRDVSGNTWLTSFVLKSFGAARPYIFVDPDHITRAKIWLERNQKPNGCFLSVGKLLHTGMKGGVSDEVSLTAYITAALIELEGNVTDPVVVKSLACLKAASQQTDHMYTTALLAYTFTLAGDADTRSALITHLDKVSENKGGSRHWQPAGTSDKGVDSTEVEMTSYVLLALLKGPLLPKFGLGYASSIVRWLTQQQNPNGGFASTQDTVVALKALSEYGASTYSPDGSSEVTVESAGGYKGQFSVDQHNRLLYQEEQLQEVPGNYTIKAVGQNCVFVQIALRYNIPPPPDYSSFNISTQTRGICSGAEKKTLTVDVEVRYNGKRESTNMVIINIKLLSGYLLDKDCLRAMRRDPTVKRVDQEEGHVIIYLDGLRQAEGQTYSLNLLEDVPVRNLKPAVVKVYDYYQTSDEAVSDYSSPCAEGDDLNQL
ncbi:hypothetical protein AAFF_G00440210 [Aldrovandia affinis]|uniref:Alpha-2-macroglobulin n=1 Tax=Aldrovandia affinis TaxID=143900 RepID=A0AAD7S728_9TELE|nr:hypothetical protein AAFF_G00440210 [Aldrovandia affinis]